MRFTPLLMFACAPSVPPSEPIATADAWLDSSAPVRWLSDIVVHRNGSITYSDHEAPQMIAHRARAKDAGASEASVLGADRVIAGLRPQFRSCFNKGLQTDPKMEGKVVFHIVVPPDGQHPSAAVVGGSGLSEGVTTCMKKRMEAVSFDPPGGDGSSIQVPITFVQQARGAPQFAAYLDLDALGACRGDAGASASATFTIDSADGSFDVHVDPYQGDPELLSCAAAVVARLEKGAAPLPFRFRITFD